MTATLTTCRFCDDPLSSSLDECLACRRASVNKEFLMAQPPIGEWIGTPPVSCDLCRMLIGDTFVDGKTKMGPWANMCPKCHRSHGVGLGTGKGQKYSSNGDSFVKTEG